ncbi:MAG TPA: hypothetical protein VF316_07595 [Polyangiaceae bacterium]
MRESASLLTLGLAVMIIACSSSPSAADAGADAAVLNQDAAIGADASSEADADKRAGYGEPCTVGDDTTCVDGFLCLQGPSGGKTGFCTKTCPSTSSAACPGTPAGTSAYCVVTDVDAQGDKGCAFVCREGAQTYACPGALQCETAEDPPGSGQYLCLP